MGQGRPLGGANYGAAHARIDLDLSSLTSASQVARAAGDATAKAIEQSLKIVLNEQKIALQQAQQATATIRAQQSQITASAQAETAERKAAAISEAAVVQQQAKAQTATVIEEQRRQTAAYKQELKERDRSQRQSQVNSSSFGQNAAGFVGAAFGGPIGGLVGAAATGNYGIAAGLAINQGVQFAVQAAQTATAYNRQEVAARSLAGGQAKLNELMGAYEKASGGAIDKATALANVTRLEATGFAKSGADLERFVTGVRGAAIAMGKAQDDISQEVQLAISNQSVKRLDQIGLGVQETTDRITQLRAANKGLSEDAAFAEAVLGLLNEKFGTLTRSAEGQATGVERLSKVWKDYSLAVGQGLKEPVNQSAGFFADILGSNNQYQKTKQEIAANPSYKLPIGASQAEKNAYLNEHAEQEQRAAAKRFWDMAMDGLTQAILASQGIPYTPKPNIAGPSFNGPVPSWMTSATPNANTSRIPSRFTDDQQSALVDWNTKRVAIERESQAAVAAEARSWGNQRLEAERAYTKSSVREAEDWSRQQSRTIEDFQEGQSKNAKDYAKQQDRAERDLGRSIAQAQADDADKVADIRKDSAKRAMDIEQDYADQRAKAARDHSDKLLDAAGALDAKAVYQEQRNYAEQAGDAEKAHTKSVKDNKDQMQERLDDEAKSLRKSIDQQRTALSQREADQAEDYDQSNKDAQAQFTKEQGRAEQDRGVRLGRMATDQADQLTAIDNAHNANMAAIAQRADDENKAIQKILTDAHITVKGFVDTSVDDAIKAYDKYYTHMDDVLSGKIKPGDTSATGIAANRSGAGGSSGAYAPGSSRATGTSPGNYTPGASPAGYAAGGWVQRGGMALVHTGEYVIPAARASSMASSAGNVGYSVVFQPGSIVVYEADDAERTVNLVIEKINTAFEQKRRAA